MLVREVMSNEAITVPLGTTVKSALAVLSSARITSIPVVSASGKLRGIVSEADLIRDGVSADARLHEIPRENVLVDHHHYVDDVMTTHVLTVGPDSDLAEAVELMTSTGVKSVPVVAGQRQGAGGGQPQRRGPPAGARRPRPRTRRRRSPRLRRPARLDGRGQRRHRRARGPAPGRSTTEAWPASSPAPSPASCTSTSPRPAECRGPVDTGPPALRAGDCGLHAGRHRQHPTDHDERHTHGRADVPPGHGQLPDSTERPVSTRVHAPVGLPVQTARELVSLAIRAPSVHNTQPWAWRIGPDSIELYADESRRLDAADPAGRNLVISCGAALHHLRVAARASGLMPEVARLPDAADPDLLARVTFTPADLPSRQRQRTCAPSRSAAPTAVASPRGRCRTSG